MNLIVDGRWGGATGIGRAWHETLIRKPNDINILYTQKQFATGDILSPLYLNNEINNNGKFDAFYSPAFMPPIFSKIPTVITVYDITHYYYYSLFHKTYFKYIMGYLFKNVSQIITASEYTKSKLVDVLNVRPENIKVIYLGVEQIYAVNQESYQSQRPYFLYVGNRRSYKNIERMLAAFAAAKIPKDYMMYLSGMADDPLLKVITKLDITDRVVFLGKIDEKDLPKVYKGAHAVLFVSLMEGFGLPLIESMASGTPVIASNTTSLLEISGDAALLVNPLDVQKISHAIEKIVFDKHLYQEFQTLGIEHALKFNWDTCASEIWSIVKKTKL